MHNLTWVFDHEWLLVVIRVPSFLIWDFFQFYCEIPSTWKMFWNVSKQLTNMKMFWNVNKQLKNTKTFWDVNKQLSLSNQYQNFFILILRDRLTKKGKLFLKLRKYLYQMCWSDEKIITNFVVPFISVTRNEHIQLSPKNKQKWPKQKHSAVL